jgi:intracellular sulfur oxidation DsrE/DsrF family protein
MKSKYFKIAVFTIISILSITANADHKKSECTNAAIEASEAYDPGSSTLLNCIGVRDEFKVVIAWNNNVQNGKIFKTTGAVVSQQVVNVRNLTRDYLNNYGMVHGQEYKAVVVVFAGGVDWLKNTTDQTNQDMINSIMAQGIKIYACQNTMKSKGLILSDLLPGVEVVPAGVSAMVDFQNRKYITLTP